MAQNIEAFASASAIWVGKKPKFLNLLKVDNPADLSRFPEAVRKAIRLETDGVVVDSREYEEGEKIPFGSFIAWETCEHERCPNGYNLWCKSNAPKQLQDGVLEEVDGKYRLTKIVPYKAQLFTGEIPALFAEYPTFEDQVKVTDGMLQLETPWGISSCKTGEGFALVYGIYGEDEKEPKFRGKLNANILTVGTPTFEEYFVLDEEGNVVETLRAFYDKL